MANNITKVDELEMVNEDDEDEIDWYDLFVIMLKQTHPFAVVAWYNRFNPMHLRLTQVYTEVFIIILFAMLYLDNWYIEGHKSLLKEGLKWNSHDGLFDLILVAM